MSNVIMYTFIFIKVESRFLQKIVLLFIKIEIKKLSYPRETAES